MSIIGTNIMDIEMDKIGAGPSQSRQRDTAVSNDDDLVSSIKKNGLLSPIIVKRQEGGKFEVVVGQRRFLAHQILKKPSIKACVLEEGVSEIDARKISLIENLARKDMKRADYTDTVQWFMDRYGTTKVVAEELGISTATVRKYLTIGRLPVGIRDDINEKKYETRHALRALDALGGDESLLDVDNLREIAIRLKDLTAPVQKKVVDIKKHEPGTPIQKVVEKAMKATETHKFNIEVTLDQEERVGAFQYREKYKTRERAIEELIDMGLNAAEL